ncbi:MAG: NYN domain-containing protein [Microbacterium sp.]|uniref:NYN domain-containing protein n=1 Tax=Microbacterium sp. TaxID=51671 RepID=UPI003A854CBA
MPEASDSRIAVYIDFDNIVISRYDQVNGRGSFMKDRGVSKPSADFAPRLKRATVDLGAIIDFAASFGTLVLTRAYADWSAPVNADYRTQLVGRAVDLVQLFPAAAYGKNGADIRLAVDAVEDMFRLPDLTHVVIVSGDSDYVPLAQRCKRLGRYVIGVGVAGSTAKSLAAACDEFASYDGLPGVPAVPPEAETERPAKKPAAKKDATDDKPAAVSTTAKKPRAKKDAAPPAPTPQEAASVLLERALRLETLRTDEDWVNASAVKDLLKRMDPSFSEKDLGHRSFTDFIRAQSDVAELREEGNIRHVRLISG